MSLILFVRIAVSLGSYSGTNCFIAGKNATSLCSSFFLKKDLIVHQCLGTMRRSVTGKKSPHHFLYRNGTILCYLEMIATTNTRYRNSSSNDLLYWGLDYPPLTAYHSWAMGRVYVFCRGGCPPHLPSASASSCQRCWSCESLEASSRPPQSSSCVSRCSSAISLCSFLLSTTLSFIVTTRTALQIGRCASVL